MVDRYVTAAKREAQRVMDASLLRGRGCSSILHREWYYQGDNTCQLRGGQRYWTKRLPARAAADVGRPKQRVVEMVVKAVREEVGALPSFPGIVQRVARFASIDEVEFTAAARRLSQLGALYAGADYCLFALDLES
jgi:hypothetical protein